MTVNAFCPTLDSKLLGGGFNTSVSGGTIFNNDVFVSWAIPVAATATTNARYEVRFTRRQGGGETIQVFAYAICSP